MIKKWQIKCLEALEGWKEFCAKANKSPKEWLQIAKDLAANNGGLLPTYMRLCQEGYGALVRAMKRSPELFSGLQQERDRVVTVEEWIHVAEELANVNEGIIPHVRWLYRNGYRPLADAMYCHPDLFSHLKRRKLGPGVKSKHKYSSL